MTDPTTPQAAPEAAVDSFRKHAERIIGGTVAASLEVPGVHDRLGPQPEEMLSVGLRFTTDGIATAMAHGTTDLLDDQLLWALDRLPHDGVPPTDLLHRMGLYRREVERTLPEEHARHVLEYVDWMTARLDELITADR